MYGVMMFGSIDYSWPMIGMPSTGLIGLLERRVAVDRLLLERIRQDLLQRQVVAELVLKHAAAAAQRELAVADDVPREPDRAAGRCSCPGNRSTFSGSPLVPGDDHLADAALRHAVVGCWTTKVEVWPSSSVIGL